MFKPTQARIQVKERARHYWLERARWSLKRNDIEELHSNLQVAECMQTQIEEIENAICC